MREVVGRGVLPGELFGGRVVDCGEVAGSARAAGSTIDGRDGRGTLAKRADGGGGCGYRRCGDGGGSGSGGGGGGVAVAPAIIGVQRRVERERVKDVLNRWLRSVSGNRQLGPCGACAIARCDATPHVCVDERAKVDVRGRARRFARRFAGGAAEERSRARRGRWGREALGRGCGREAPARAHVLGLRRFWEGVGRGEVL